MQMIMNIAPEDNDQECTRAKPHRIPVVSPNFFLLTVICWVSSVAVVGTIVGLVCTEFLGEYTSLLRNLGTGW